MRRGLSTLAPVPEPSSDRYRQPRAQTPPPFGWRQQLGADGPQSASEPHRMRPAAAVHEAASMQKEFGGTRGLTQQINRPGAPHDAESRQPIEMPPPQLTA